MFKWYFPVIIPLEYTTRVWLLSITFAEKSVLINVTAEFPDPDNIENKDDVEPGNLLVPINNIFENYKSNITDNKITKTKLLDFDVGSLKNEKPNASEIEEAVCRGLEKIPSQFPKDVNGHSFSVCILHTSMKNGEYVPRDWLVWSKVKQSIFCFPCRLFSKLPTASRSRLTTISGYCFQRKWKKLHDKISEHQNSSNHKYCYIKWWLLEKSIDSNSTVDIMLLQAIKNQASQWGQVLRRILDVTLFLAERGLGFRGTSDFVGVAANGNFLGIYLNYLNKVMKSQKMKRRQQANYLSPEIQNEFICCAKKVLDVILSEREAAKYYSIFVDATPDSAHMEQTAFILRYVYLNDENSLYEVQERFLEFVDCNQKTEKAIAELICSVIKKHNIPMIDCRGQSYDNGSNMSGQYKGAQAEIIKENQLAIYSPCACHSLNLCGVHAAECCAEVILLPRLDQISNVLRNTWVHLNALYSQALGLKF
ncbi:zinc finger MYM-type protein 1-like [Hydra vulgaris]|uniref:zinc finger MYM-type protein 1-like n=1 Tax=Hydra vulgaris TaxID=6087 RepID=UPI001F5FAFE1|nr:zinc finger MYM-type protein 1-like [Hydra vulgaris]